MAKTEVISCPFCGAAKANLWAEEAGWSLCKCGSCGFFYLNPRPSLDLRNKATELGVHVAANNLNIVERHVPKKVELYKRILVTMFSDVWRMNEPVSWIDLGAGYGEMVEAVRALAHPNSFVVGLEPMRPKAENAISRGLHIISGFIDETTPRCSYASAIDVFSHVYNFDNFLSTVRGVLHDGGNLLLVTGNMSDVERRSQFPGELGLPDHVAFASESHLRELLRRNGFEVLAVDNVRVDGFLGSMKNSAKRIFGRQVTISIPYTSPYREIRIRARKVNM